jgi:hypothetical protein
MKQIYFLITLLTTLTIGILSVNSVGIAFALEKNETSEIDDSPLITTAEIDEGLENNTSSQMANNTSIIE